MSESNTETNTGVQSTNNDASWSSIFNRKNGRGEDIIISTLMNDAFATNKEIKYENKDLTIIVKTFNEYLKNNKLDFSFSFNILKDDKKAKKLTSKEKTLMQVKESNTKKEMEKFISTLQLNEHNMPIKNINNIESYFSIVYWNINLLKNKKKNIDMSIYLNAAISLYRAINDSKIFLTIEIIDETYKLLDKVENYIIEKISKTQSLYDFLLNESVYLLESYWDTIKPKSIALYKEQKDIISYVSKNLHAKKLTFYQMPPSNGKTILSAILAKVLSGKKIVIYSCYSSIVTNEVAKLCILNNVDVKFCLAYTKLDPYDSVKKTYIRPFMNCYPLWNQQKLRTKDENKYFKTEKHKKYSENLLDQFEFFINDTKPKTSKILEGIKAMDEINKRFNMLICDLESTYNILKFFNKCKQDYPDLFPEDIAITYFDEAFASAELDITAKIMSQLGHSVLVSATLAEPSEIPIVINDFKKRHNHEDDSFLNIIKVNKQHISCTFIDEEGNIFSPHDKVNNFDELNTFIKGLKHPLIQRGYSPEVVLNIVKRLNEYLPDELKFRNKFNYFGLITHESIRHYASDILIYIYESKNEEIFNILKSIKINKIKNINIDTIFTENAINYQLAKTLHVATTERFNNHIEKISAPFLKGSPKISDVISKYDGELKIINNELLSLDKNGDKNSEFEKMIKMKEIDNLKLDWPSEFIMNSKAHANKYKNLSLLTNPNNSSMINRDDLEILDDISEKLLFSDIGIYQPENNNFLMDLFLKKKDNFKFILSTPSIVYGTNISLSVIDIDDSFLVNSTKNTLYQLIGRAGRRGKSNSALVIFRNNKMIDMILENNDINIEAIQVENHYKNLLK